MFSELPHLWKILIMWSEHFHCIDRCEFDSTTNCLSLMFFHYSHCLISRPIIFGCYLVCLPSRSTEITVRKMNDCVICKEISNCCKINYDNKSQKYLRYGCATYVSGIACHFFKFEIVGQSFVSDVSVAQLLIADGDIVR